LRAIIVVMKSEEQVLCSGEETKMKKRFVSVLTAAILSAALLAGCGGSGASTSASGDQAASAGGSEESKTITVAASPTPHSEILEAAKPLLAEKGYELDIKVFEDYVQPNEVVNSGEIDCNYFQHVPYLESFNEEKGTDLVVAGKIHYEPLGIYPGTKKTLEEIGDGDVIAIPNDTTNEARALLLLQDNGIIKLKDGAGITATKQDIAENPHNVEIKELEAAQIPRVKEEVAYAIMNGNYALEAGFVVSKDALAYEQSDSEAAKTYVNVIAVKAGNENNEGIKALVSVLESQEIKDFINGKYEGAVVPFEE
jgi:D-methionine transport system substrate-binding protein